MEYSVGDKVRIVSKWNDGCNQNFEGKMDKWLGSVMTIREVDKDVGCYKMEEDIAEYDHGWEWFEAAIAELVTKQNQEGSRKSQKHISKEDDINKVVAALREMTQSQVAEVVDLFADLIETYCGILLQ